MIIVSKAREGNGVSLKGDFFDLDRLYLAIYKYTGFHGVDSKCTFPRYDAVCENLLGLCYEIRHAWQGDRNIEQVFNGIHEDCIARITLFTNQTLHTLYRFIGEKRYTAFINKFYSQNDFFLNCDLEHIISIF